MSDFTGTTTVAADPQAVFDYLSDVANLPHYFSRMTSAEPTSGNEVHTTAQLPDGRKEEGEAWFRADPDTKRIEWGSEGKSDYHGYLDITAGGIGSEIELHLHSEKVHGGSDQVQQGIDGTLQRIKQQIG